MLPDAIDTKRVEKSALLYSRGILFDIFPYFTHNIKDKFAYSIDISLILYYNLRENNGGKEMRSFNYSAFKEQKWDSDILGLIAAIYKEAGKQEQYLKQRPQEMEKLVEIAKIQSTEASNAIEGIVTTNTRIKQLVEEKTTPRNRDEQEIAGYRDVLNVIHESFDAIPITHNYILQLHKMLYSHMNNPLAGRTKACRIISVRLTPMDIQKYCLLRSRQMKHLRHLTGYVKSIIVLLVIWRLSRL